MALIIAALLVIAFTANVAIGSINGTPVVGNVAEMIMLFLASIAFVVAVLKREAAEKELSENDH
ncbi:MAG: hypothetical protein GKR98_10205 [Boseongicola sp.]|nr:MAG: hypothetical protein GKR98_10205 [Boseongicola sp.]